MYTARDVGRLALRTGRKGKLEWETEQAGKARSCKPIGRPLSGER